MQDITPYLEKAEQYHGHICSGQILGIRMTLMALEALGMSPHDDMRDLVIFLETDRCVADASYVVTGVTVGRRRVKMYSYGKTAMSFLDLKSGKAVRVSVITSDRPPHHADKAAQLAFWEGYADSDIFSCQPVNITMPEGELPGPPARIATCCVCGEDVLDCKEVVQDGKTYCRACLNGAYYSPIGGSHA